MAKKKAVKPETKKAVKKVAVSVHAMKQRIADLEMERDEQTRQIAWYKRQLARKGSTR